MTKALTTVGLLQLVENGAARLDDTVASVIPAFGDLQVLDGFDDDGAPVLRPPATQATIRQLLNHTAGHGYHFLNEHLTRYHEVTGLPDALTAQRAFLSAPLVNDPGTTWEYGINTDWAGQVIEALSGQTLDTYLKERLFDPLGMSSTTFSPDDSYLGRTMAIHQRLEDGSLVPNGIEWPAEPEIRCGGHAAFSTAGDYCRFMRALLRGGELDGERVLTEATVTEAFSDQLGGIALPEVIRSANPLLSNDIVSPPVPQGWGLGFHLMLADLPGMRASGTGDWAGLANCYYWIDRSSGVCGAIFTQVLPFFDERIVGTALQFEAAVYAQEAGGRGGLTSAPGNRARTWRASYRHSRKFPQSSGEEGRAGGPGGRRCIVTALRAGAGRSGRGASRWPAPCARLRHALARGAPGPVLAVRAGPRAELDDATAAGAGELHDRRSGPAARAADVAAAGLRLRRRFRPGRHRADGCRARGRGGRCRRGLDLACRQRSGPHADLVDPPVEALTGPDRVVTDP